MRTTAILNLKGGVGKTTTVINMAAILAKWHSKRVLIIDADPQCNSTEFFGGMNACMTLAELLRGSEVYNSFDSLANLKAIVMTKWPNIDLLPADDSLMDLDLTKVEQKAVRADILRKFLSVVSANYDFVLIDCPPSFNAACVAALVAADDVIIPIKLDAFSLRGMTNLTRQIRNMCNINPDLRCAGLLPTMWYRSDKIAEAEQTLLKNGFRVFPHIRASKTVDTMTWKQSPLSFCSPKSGAEIDYKRFVKAYLGGEQDGI